MGRSFAMEEVRVTLCPDCDRCPEVVITDECVCIGEDENTVRLSHEEWNELVDAIQRGDLKALR
jgi:hypothetical protein